MMSCRTSLKCERLTEQLGHFRRGNSSQSFSQLISGKKLSFQSPPPSMLPFAHSLGGTEMRRFV